VAARLKAWVSGRSFAGVAGWNPAGGMDVCLLCVLCRWKFLQRTDHSSRGVQRIVVCLSVIVTHKKWEGADLLGVVILPLPSPSKKKRYSRILTALKWCSKICLEFLLEADVWDSPLSRYFRVFFRVECRTPRYLILQRRDLFVS